MKQKLSLIIPVYNEAPLLEEFLVSIDHLKLDVDKELIIIDDASSDGSWNILKSFCFSSSVVLLQHQHNQGKGAAIRTGIPHATGDFIGIQDADLETVPSEITGLLGPLLDGVADVAYGSRFKGSSSSSGKRFHYFANRVLTILSNLLSGLELSDMETCYKFFRSEIIKNIRLKSNRFGFDPEVTAKIARLNVRITELPVSYYPRKYIEGKKLNWKDGVPAVTHIFYFNLMAKFRFTSCFHRQLPERYLGSARYRRIRATKI